MNLRQIANAHIQVVNPDQEVIWKRSSGSETQDDGTVVPTYEEIVCPANVQAVSGKMLEHINSMNIQGVMRSLWLDENALGVSYRSIRGGDVFSFREFNGSEATDWKVVQVVATWDTWCNIVVVQQ